MKGIRVPIYTYKPWIPQINLILSAMSNCSYDTYPVAKTLTDCCANLAIVDFTYLKMFLDCVRWFDQNHTPISPD